MRNPWRVLGVDRDAPPEVVKVVYRALAEKWHPDKNPGSAEAKRRMQEINEAYAAIQKMWRDPQTGGRRFRDPEDLVQEGMALGQQVGETVAAGIRFWKRIKGRS